MNEEHVTRLLEAVAVLRTEQARMKADLAEIKQDLKALSLKPARRWEAVAEKALLCLVSAVIALALGHIGLG